MKGKSGQVKIGQFMSGSIQSVHIKDLSIENLTSSSLQYGVVSLPQLVSSSVALLAKLVIVFYCYSESKIVLGCNSGQSFDCYSSYEDNEIRNL